jgi:uncharacterized damage-inducible protein DinB
MPTIHYGTVCELLAHAEWARERLLAAASEVPDEQLDRPFELGCGSLRETLRHLYGAERVWLERWTGEPPANFPRSHQLERIGELWDAHRALGNLWRQRIETQPAQLEACVTYTTSTGKTFSNQLGDIVVHLANHGVHHRAQALNMLRRQELQPPRVDYLLMKLERPTIQQSDATAAALRAAGIAVAPDAWPAPDLDAATLRRLFGYCDWATMEVLRRADQLSDAELDRTFEMGLGSLRKTLLHLVDAERWWHANWIDQPPREIDRLPPSTSSAELLLAYQEAAGARNEFLRDRSAHDLQQTVTAYLRPDVAVRFRLGESLLQLSTHGTHHRAQAVNMIRHLGMDGLFLDYVFFARREPDGQQN